MRAIARLPIQRPASHAVALPLGACTCTPVQTHLLPLRLGRLARCLPALRRLVQRLALDVLPLRGHGARRRRAACNCNGPHAGGGAPPARRATTAVYNCPNYSAPSRRCCCAGPPGRRQQCRVLEHARLAHLPLLAGRPACCTPLRLHNRTSPGPPRPARGAVAARRAWRQAQRVAGVPPKEGPPGASSPKHSRISLSHQPMSRPPAAMGPPAATAAGLAAAGPQSAGPPRDGPAAAGPPGVRVPPISSRRGSGAAAPPGHAPP